MAFSRDELPTAVKVRRKRRAAESEKWSTGRRRRPELQKRPVQTVASTPEQLSLRPRKRKQKTLDDQSPLERLPAEVLQQVFEYSINIDLPLVSRELALKLSRSHHLQHQLTSQLLHPILGHASPCSRHIKCATRLLNSRFMTWDFFVSWLRSQVASTGFIAGETCWNVARVREAWLALQPSPALLPPKKLLCSPFNQEKAQFLSVLSYNISNVAEMDAAYGEISAQGLNDAIREGQHGVIQLLLSMGTRLSTDLLRVAVTEAGCDEAVVRMLVEHTASLDSMNSSAVHEPHASGAVDLLDPMVWAWADQAQKRGNDRGRWLVDFLRDAQQRTGHARVDISHGA